MRQKYIDKKRGEQMEITKQILNKGHRLRRSGVFEKSSITIHSAANPNSTAKNERAWLDNPSNTRDASWHYVVDETMIIQGIPEREEAWHSGKQEGNRYSIGIEICESQDRRKTLERAAEFVAEKLREYDWGIERIKKHYDWTGKNCPRILLDSAYIQRGMNWDWFLDKVSYYLKEGGNMAKEKRNNTIEEIPDWAKATLQKLMDKGVFAEPKKLDLSEDMVRLLVVNDRAGSYQ